MLLRHDMVGAAVCVRCVCCAFQKIPPGNFPPEVFFIYFLGSPPYLWVTPGVIVFRKKYTSPRGGNSEDITVLDFDVVGAVVRRKGLCLSSGYIVCFPPARSRRKDGCHIQPERGTGFHRMGAQACFFLRLL